VAWRDEGGDVRGEALNVGMRDLFNSPCTTPQLFGWLRDLTKSRDWLAFHNAGFDLPYLLRIGVLNEDLCQGRIFDTMVTARYTDSRESVSLSKLCDRYGIGTDQWRGMKGKRKKLGKLSADVVLEYGTNDAINTLLLAEQIHKEATSLYSKEWLQAEGDFILLIAQMRVSGIAIDLPAIARITEEQNAELDTINNRLMSVQILGATDNKKLRLYLLSQECLLEEKTSTGRDKLDEGVLREIQAYHQGEVASVITDVLRGRHIRKSLSTWLDGLRDQADDNGRVHPLFVPGGTVSGRLTCQYPNAQAIPRTMKLFAPGKRTKALVSLDYAQAELRLASMYAGETAMAKIFTDPNADPHLETARIMYGDEKAKEYRFRGKRANFAVLYGIGARSLAATSGLTIKQAKEVMELHRQRFPRFAQVTKSAESRWVERGYLVVSSGRRLFASPFDIKHRSYKAFNQLIQGSVACVMQTAMLGIHAQIPEARIVSQVHDSIVLEVLSGDIDDVCRRAVAIMETAVPERILKMVSPRIPMNVDIKLDVTEEE